MMADRSRAFQSALRKGYEAFHAGEKKTACPYTDHRTWYGGVTFSRAFIKRWEEGWESASEGKTLEEALEF